MKILKNNLTSPLNLRTEKNFPKDGIEFIDVNPLLLNPITFKEIVDKFVAEIKDKNADYIVGPEARGFLFGSAIAYELGIGFLPVRKKNKMPPTTVAVEFDYEKEYGKDTLALPKLINEPYTGKKFYIIDDLYATGNTANAIKNALEDLGGNVVGTGVILNIKELNNNKNLFSLIDINEE
jgi:adenine phosphoribosyltransferase